MGKLAPDRRPDLRHLLGRAEPVEPRHQRCVQACRHRQAEDGTAAADAPRCALALRLQHRLRHLLDEQRNAVGALDDLRRMSAGSAWLPTTPSIMAADFALAQAD